MELRRQRRMRVIAAVLVFTLVAGVLGSTIYMVFLADRTEKDAAATTTTTTTAPVEPCPAVPPPPPKEEQLPAPPPTEIDTAKTYKAEMQTSCGTMMFDLDPASATVDVNNFVYLARKGFYDGLVFHRVIKGFMIQGGDPFGTDKARAGQGSPGYSYTGSTPTTQPGAPKVYKVGSLAMANSGDPSSNGSQFFIVSGPQGEALPPKYSLFGQITNGMDVLTKIAASATDEKDYPTEPVVINKVTITES